MQAIEDTLKDNQWHKVDVQPLTQAAALCLRKDARLLAMSPTQFDMWSEDELLRARLQDMATGKGQQVKQERLQLATTNTKVGDGAQGHQSNREKDDVGPHLQVTVEIKHNASTTKVGTAIAVDQSGHIKEDSIAQATEKIAKGILEGAGSGTHYFLPPCYCVSCSVDFWTRGFAGLLDHEVAASRVQQWVSNIFAKSQNIAQYLRQEKSLRRRWIRKSVSQRIQILTNACPSLTTHNEITALLGERGPSQKRKQWVKPSRLGLLISILVLDDLSAQPDLLFDHLLDRIRHPSQHFLADYMRVESAAHYTNSLKHPYIFGTFQISEDSNYGRWREWEDRAVHQFEAVVAPFSFLVFESQSKILDVLFEVVSQLAEGLSVSAGQEDTFAVGRYVGERSEMAAPSLEEVRSLYTLFPQSAICLETARDIALVQVEEVSVAFKCLRTDNTLFAERLRASYALRNATRTFTRNTSPTALVATLVLAEPHDRATLWAMIRTQFARLLKARGDRGGLSADGYRLYIDEFKVTFAMLYQRFYQLMYTAGVFCSDPISPEVIIPGGFLNGRWTVQSWLCEYFFPPFAQKSRILALRHMQVRFEQQAEDVRFINDVVKEWIEEVLVVRRVLEILHACEPTVQLHFLDPLEMPRTVWYNMCPSLSVKQHENRMEERGQALKNILYPVTDYTLPTGRRDAAWHAKQTSARDALKQTWTKYGKLTLEYWKQKGSKEEWLKAIEATLPYSGHDENPSTPRPAVEPRTPTKRQVTTPPMTPTSIPHQYLPEGASERKLTKKKRGELNLPAEEDDEVTSPSKEVEVLITEQAALTVTEIQIKETYLEVVDSLFSNAQQQVSSVRWTKFSNFMRDAGCEVKTSEGSGYTFTSRNVVTGENATVVLHRPHPDATLRAVHLRNNKFRIAEAFGWRQEMFVARK
ncbi:hypothetical protein OHC33_004014 [Knufia fluminis]|uniref:Uncharacterized protein n=1 Tax=Knufia fluminis TaxID=191047 RepID=A0AAN8EP01_9EURO|nr:hypothetical protein OHC33_004014 [Knufia fluminis]